MKIYNPTFKNGRGGFQQQWVPLSVRETTAPSGNKIRYSGNKICYSGNKIPWNVRETTAPSTV